MAIKPATAASQTSTVCRGNLTPTLLVDGRKFRLGEPEKEGFAWIVPVDEKNIRIETLSETSTDPHTFLFRVGRRVYRVSSDTRVKSEESRVELNGQAVFVTLEEDSPVQSLGRTKVPDGPVLVKSPMAGKIASVKVSTGDSVGEGQALIVLEAMKMENEIATPKSGTVKEIYVQRGAVARPGDKLVLVE